MFEICIEIGFLPLSWRSGMTGIAVVLASTQKNAPSKTRLPISEPITHPFDHGSSFPPRLRPTSWTEIAVTSRNAPAKSTFVLISFHVGCSSIGFSITSHPRNSATTDTGTWRMKHQRLGMLFQAFDFHTWLYVPSNGIGNRSTKGCAANGTESKHSVLQRLVHTPLAEGDHI